MNKIPLPFCFFVVPSLGTTLKGQRANLFCALTSVRRGGGISSPKLTIQSPTQSDKPRRANGFPLVATNELTMTTLWRRHLSCRSSRSATRVLLFCSGERKRTPAFGDRSRDRADAGGDRRRRDSLSKCSVPQCGMGGGWFPVDGHLPGPR